MRGLLALSLWRWARVNDAPLHRHQRQRRLALKAIEGIDLRQLLASLNSAGEQRAEPIALNPPK